MDAATFTAARRDLSERLTLSLREAFTGLESWREPDVAAFTRHAEPAVRGAQTTLAGLVSTYLAADAAAATGTTVAPPPIPASRVTNLRRVPHVYRRPFVALWDALSRGKTLRTAIDLGAVRLTEIAELDMQQAHSHALREGMQRLPQQQQPRLWRRVLMGEKSCGLCVLASTHRYTTEDLNPIHAHCDCAVAGIYGADTTRAADDAALEQLHAAVAELTGLDASELQRGGRTVDYRQIHITREHGELGAMLARPNDRFTTADQIPGLTQARRRKGAA